MRHSSQMQLQKLGGRWFLYVLVCIVLLGAFWGCGKLSDDTGESSSSVGTSSAGTSIDFGVTSTAGTYELALAASPTSIEADLTNYSTLTATLSDSGGRSVGGYAVVFYTSANLGYFYNDTNGWTTSASAYTSSDGEATIRLYGGESGSETVTAAIDMDGDNDYDMAYEISMTFTSSSTASSAGTYRLTVSASPTSIPADNATYSTISAYVTDSSGGSVQGLTIEFSSELGYLNNTPSSGSTSTTESAITGENGGVSLYYYADRAGSATIYATVEIPDLPTALEASTHITVTEGSGDLGDDVAGLFVEVSPNIQNIEADTTTGYGDTDTVTFEVSVWDETGDPASAGVRVEFSGDIIGYASTDSSGIATLEFEPGTLYIGTYTYDVTVCTTINSVEYCEDTSFIITVTPPELEVEVSAVPSSIVYNQTATVLVTVTYLGDPVSGASVSFVTGGIVTPTSATATTNSSGIAQLTVTGSTFDGTDTVRAVVQTTRDGYTLSGSAETSITVAAP